MGIMKQGLQPHHLTVIDPSEYIRANKTVPTYLDRSDDVAWILGCTLLIFTMQVNNIVSQYFLFTEMFSADWDSLDRVRDVFSEERGSPADEEHVLLLCGRPHVLGAGLGLH